MSKRIHVFFPINLSMLGLVELLSIHFSSCERQELKESFSYECTADGDSQSTSALFWTKHLNG